LRLQGRFIAQGYVGTPNEEYTVGILFGQDGVLLNSIAIRRIINNALTIRTQVPNRTGRSELGDHLIVSTGVSQGEVGHWPEIRSQCEVIAASLAPQAPINLQCRVVDGHVFPFEINPRFSGTTSLRALAGYNEPDTLIRRDVLGEAIEPHFAFRGMTIMRGLQEMIVR
jgi:carbamoyl-phosphate synthase large subunit